MIPEILKSALIGLSIFVLLILIAATGGGISSNGLLISCSACVRSRVFAAPACAAGAQSPPNDGYARSNATGDYGRCALRRACCWVNSSVDERGLTTLRLTHAQSWYPKP